MQITKHRLRLSYTVSLTLSVLLQAAPPAFAEDAYPPGWNVSNESVGPILYDFRPGCWNDYRRYWPEQESCKENVPSRPNTYGSMIHEMDAQGERYHRVERSAVVPTDAPARLTPDK